MRFTCSVSASVYRHHQSHLSVYVMFVGINYENYVLSATLFSVVSSESYSRVVTEAGGTMPLMSLLPPSGHAEEIKQSLGATPRSSPLLYKPAANITTVGVSPATTTHTAHSLPCFASPSCVCNSSTLSLCYLFVQM